MPDEMRTEVVEKYVTRFSTMSEADRETWLMDPNLDFREAERREIRRILWSKSRSPSLTSEFRKSEAFTGLIHDVRRGRAALFIGAGVAFDAGMPSSEQLAHALKLEAKSYGIPVDDKKEYKLEEIADEYDKGNRRASMIEELLKRIKDPRRQPPPFTRGFYRLLPHLRELNELIITTNWDDQIERAFDQAQLPYLTILQSQQLSQMNTSRHVVFKVHGDISTTNLMIVSKTDYLNAIKEITQPGQLAGSLWGAVANLLGQKSMIFVGYHMTDPNINLLQTLVESGRQGNRISHYAVGPFTDAQAQDLSGWKSVKVIQATAKDFFAALAQELAQFSNRHDDLERIFRLEVAPFLEFCAPLGSGKHALIEEIERRALGEGWRAEDVIRLDLKEIAVTDTSPPSIMPKLVQATASALNRPSIDKGEDLRQALQQKQRFIMLIENTEAIKSAWSDFIDFLVQVVADAIRKCNEADHADDRRSRLILAGRYPIKHSDKYWPIRFGKEREVYYLSPFRLSAVREMVGKYMVCRDPEAPVEFPSDELIRQIYEVTGRSNPKFIRHILDYLMSLKDQNGRLIPPQRFSDDQIRQLQSSFFTNIRDDVWSGAPEGLEALFSNGLCVLRKLNPALINRLADHALLNEYFLAVGNSHNVVDGLKKRHLLTYKYPMHLVDPVIRRIHCSILQYSEKSGNRIIAIHQAAASAWKDLLPSTYDTTRLIYIQEWLYHETSRLSLTGQGRDENWNNLKTEFDRIMFRMDQDNPGGMGIALLEEIEQNSQQHKDHEVLDAVLNAIGEDNYDHLRELVSIKMEVPI